MNPGGRTRFQGGVMVHRGAIPFLTVAVINTSSLETCTSQALPPNGEFVSRGSRRAPSSIPSRTAELAGLLDHGADGAVASSREHSRELTVNEGDGHHDLRMLGDFHSLDPSKLIRSGPIKPKTAMIAC